MTVPYLEDFSTGSAGWLDANFVPASHAATGGPAGVGDAYISVVKSFTNTDQAQSVFRAHDAFNASGDAFVGDWIAAGVAEFQFWIRHDAAVDLTVGVRFATPANSPAYNITTDPIKVAPGEWTPITFEIVADNPAWVPEGPIPFADVFGNIGNLQIMARRESLDVGALVTFDLDKVGIAPVPEPSTIVLGIFGAAALGMVAIRRRKK